MPHVIHPANAPPVVATAAVVPDRPPAAIEQDYTL